jgi:hypothetical protein
MGGNESAPLVHIPIPIGAEDMVRGKNLIVYLNARKEIIAGYKINSAGKPLLLSSKEAEKALDVAAKEAGNLTQVAEGVLVAAGTIHAGVKTA